MTHFERVMTAMAHKEPDYVPVYPILSGVTRKLVGASYEKWANDADICAKALLKATDDYDLDCICTLIDLSVECDAWGQPLIYPENEAAHPDYDNLLIDDIDEYCKIQKVDYRNSKRMMMHIDVCKKLVAEKKGEVPIIAFVFGPLGVLSMMRSQQEMYMDLYDDPDAVKEAVANVNATLYEYCEAIADTGVDAVMFDTLFASGSIMSPTMWEEFEGVYIKEICDMLHKKGVAVMIHNCGKDIYFDEQIKYMDPAAISFLYPPKGCETFAECKEKYGDKLTLIGCVTPASAAIGTDEEWIKECKDNIDFFKKDGGFVLATGCEYPANASFDRAKMMVDLAKTYGKY
ncbi:MAG: uroporphyrinogen decarboxylase [Ruminococcaceae bacterium]|nr:uroporphyrinogen decarboxylase [Oscillospiraceae bacterium]